MSTVEIILLAAVAVGATPMAAGTVAHSHALQRTSADCVGLRRSGVSPGGADGADWFTPFNSSAVIAELAKETGASPTKREYFERLGTKFGVWTGRQASAKLGDGAAGAAERGHCLQTQGAAELLSATCLQEQGYSWALFLGDSHVREMAASFGRLVLAERTPAAAAAGRPFGCQPWGPNATIDTKALSQTEVKCGAPTPESWCPSSVPVPTHRAAAASTAVPAEPIANGCHWEQSWLALWQTTEEDLEAALPNLAQRIDKLSKKGKCKGLVLWSQLTAHRLWRGELSVGGGTESALSLHNQARQAWAKLVMKALKPWKPSVKVFFLTPEVINMAVMMLKPAKDDVNVAFPPKPNRHIKLWGLADSYWAFHGITKLPAYYLSQELDGMQCDGLHFGSSYDRMHDGCGGFSVMHDVLSQIMLNRVCRKRTVSACLSPSS